MPTHSTNCIVGADCLKRRETLRDLRETSLQTTFLSLRKMTVYNARRARHPRDCARGSRHCEKFTDRRYNGPVSSIALSPCTAATVGHSSPKPSACQPALRASSPAVSLCEGLCAPPLTCKGNALVSVRGPAPHILSPRARGDVPLRAGQRDTARRPTERPTPLDSAVNLPIGV